MHFSQRAQKVIVLHVSRADLQNVRIPQHHRNLRRVHHLADNHEAVFVGCLAEKLQTFFTESLERVR